MSDYKIISLDLDGTLLDREMHVSRENREAITALTARGIRIVPNSGRTLSEIPAELRDNPDIRYIIYSDGAAILDKQTGRTLPAYMSRELSEYVYGTLRRYRTMLSVRCRGISYVKAEEHNEKDYISYRVPPLYRAFLYDTNLPTSDFDSFCRELGELEMICAFFSDDAELEACTRELRSGGELQVASSVPGNIEIFSIHAGKGNALRRLARELGVDENATIAVGDTTNDSDMIRKAGLGLAMANAVPELKAMAAAVACHHTEHIVSYLAKTYF